MPLSAYAEALAERFLLQGSTVGRPTAWGAGLCSSLPDANNFAEVSGGGYQRVPVSSYSVSNGSAIAGTPQQYRFTIFPPQDIWGHGLFDNASSGGNLLLWDDGGCREGGPINRGEIRMGPLHGNFAGFEGGQNSLSLYGETLLLEYLLTPNPVTPPAKCCVGLLTGAATPSANQAPEVSGDASYQRQSATMTQGTIGATFQNQNALDFTLQNPAVISGLAIYDQPSAGSLLFAGTLNSARTAAANGTVALAPADVNVFLA